MDLMCAEELAKSQLTLAHVTKNDDVPENIDINLWERRHFGVFCQ